MSLYTIFAQKIQNENQRKLVAEMIYDINKDFFQEKANKFKVIDFKESDFFLKPFTMSEAQSCFDLMNQTSKLELNNKLKYIAQILSSLNNSDLKSSLIEIERYENKLFYGKDTLKIRPGYGGGNILEVGKYKITRSYNLKNKYSDSTKINGSLLLKIKFVIGYDTINLDKSMNNEKIKLGDNEIEIIDIIDNKIVIGGETDNVSLINFISKNKIAKELEFGDKGFVSDKKLSFSSISIYKSNYKKIIQEKISKEEFDKQMTMEKLNEVQNEEQYKVIKNVSEIGNQFILYKPRYKTFYLTVKY